MMIYCGSGGMAAKILILHMGALGDIILSFPVIQLICSAYKQPEIELMGSRESLELIASQLGARNVYSVDSAVFAPLFTLKAKISERLKAHFYEIDAVFAFLANPAIDLTANLRRIFSERLTVIPAIPANNSGTHVTFYQSQALSHLGDIGQFLPIRLDPAGKETNRLKASLPLTGRARKPPVAVHPGSGSSKKCWPEEKFKELIRELTSLGHEVLILLGPAERKKAEHFSTWAGSSKVQICSGCSLMEVAGILKGALTYAGNDSGMTHLASALGIPATVIFGPTDSRVWAPMGSQVRIVKPPRIDCSPCFDKVAGCNFQACLESITVQEVLSAVVFPEKN